MADKSMKSGIIVAVVGTVLSAIILAALGLGAGSSSGGGSDGGSTSGGSGETFERDIDYSTTCFTPYGSCPTFNSAPVGTPCSCPDGWGGVVPGEAG